VTKLLPVPAGANRCSVALLQRCWPGRPALESGKRYKARSGPPARWESVSSPSWPVWRSHWVGMPSARATLIEAIGPRIALDPDQSGKFLWADYGPATADSVEAHAYCGRDGTVRHRRERHRGLGGSHWSSRAGETFPQERL